MADYTPARYLQLMSHSLSAFYTKEVLQSLCSTVKNLRLGSIKCVCPKHLNYITKFLLSKRRLTDHNVAVVKHDLEKFRGYLMQDVRPITMVAL